MKRMLICCLSAALLGPLCCHAQIRVNQVGMYPQQEKTATIEGTVSAGRVKITEAQTGKTAVQARVLRTATSPWSGKRRTVIDFSSLTTPGTYIIRSGRHTATFEVKPQALRSATEATLKAFYLIRSGSPILAQYAGAYARPLAHPDTQVLVHPAAASPGRPAGSLISSPYGWYDAGDYNKYIVNSAFTMGIILCSYEQNKPYFDGLSVNIPESGNRTADVLDEMIYNLRWMFTMQDPYDGGVYHKLTNPGFEGFITPMACQMPRYVVQKSTCATLDFAAVMAQMARLLRGNADYPDLAEQAARAALAAYGWAERNPEVLYQQEKMNEQFDPDVSTGTYGDRNPSDEFFWAATELFLLTGDQKFAADAAAHQPERFVAPVWGNVGALGSYQWLMHQPQHAIATTSRAQLLAYCDAKLATTATSCFQTPTGNEPRDFGWGCLAEAFASQGLAMLYAHRLTGDARYYTAALQNADYIFGRNATGNCYLTGFGTHSPMHPHHRPSAADDIAAPFPGLLVGGPNPGQSDHNATSTFTYPSKQPDESYIDVTESYASNEIAINWNASLLALLGWLEGGAQ